jgi:hypothetical protein
MTSMYGGLCLKFAVGGVGEVSPLQARFTQTLKSKKGTNVIVIWLRLCTEFLEENTKTKYCHSNIFFCRVGMLTNFERQELLRIEL